MLRTASIEAGYLDVAEEGIFPDLYCALQILAVLFGSTADPDCFLAEFCAGIAAEGRLQLVALIIYSVLLSAHLGLGISPDDSVLPESSSELQNPPGIQLPPPKYYPPPPATVLRSGVFFGIPSSRVNTLLIGWASETSPCSSWVKWECWSCLCYLETLLNSTLSQSTPPLILLPSLA